MTDALDAVLHRHRGPFQLQIARTITKKPGLEVIALVGLAGAADVVDDARALLEDPRDTIVAVHVWSTHEQQHVTTIRREVRS